MMNDRPEERRLEESERSTAAVSSAPEDQSLSTADIAGGRRVEETEAPARPAPPVEAQPQASMVPPAATERAEATPLFPSDATQDFRDRWADTQTGFVDDPRKAVEQADGLVAEVMKRLAESFADERSRLEQQWDRGDAVDTENLRVALRRYRSFFDRLLSM